MPARCFWGRRTGRSPCGSCGARCGDAGGPACLRPGAQRQAHGPPETRPGRNRYSCAPKTKGRTDRPENLSNRLNAYPLIPTALTSDSWEDCGPYRRPGPRSGAQPRSWRQFQQSSLPSTGCSGGASQGWAPARGPGRRWRRLRHRFRSTTAGITPGEKYGVAAFGTRSASRGRRGYRERGDPDPPRGSAERCRPVAGRTMHRRTGSHVERRQAGRQGLDEGFADGPGARSPFPDPVRRHLRIGRRDAGSGGEIFTPEFRIPSSLKDSRRALDSHRLRLAGSRIGRSERSAAGGMGGGSVRFPGGLSAGGEPRNDAPVPGDSGRRLPGRGR